MCPWVCRGIGVGRASSHFLPTAFHSGKSPNLAETKDNYRMHKAQAGHKWLADHPRFALLWLLTYCPRAHPSERAFGDVHDKCTRNHKRKRLRDVVRDVERHLQVNGPWFYKRSRTYEEPEVTAVVEQMTAELRDQMAA